MDLDLVDLSVAAADGYLAAAPGLVAAGLRCGVPGVEYAVERPDGWLWVACDWTTPSGIVWTSIYAIPRGHWARTRRGVA